MKRAGLLRFIAINFPLEGGLWKMLARPQGELNAISTGIATIIVATRDGGHTATCIVTVYPAGPKMTMTTEISGHMGIRMAGSGTVTIDWGDGTEIETHTLQAYFDKWDVPLEHRFTHDYPNSTTSHTITIISDNVTHLSCHGYYQITSLDVSKNTVLEELQCNGNQLTSLDLSKNTKLTFLSCNQNQLKNLDLSKNTMLTVLFCEENLLTSLDLSKNILLKSIRCLNNRLASLDVSKNILLTYLVCDNNLIKNLDVSNHTDLTLLGCSGNQLTSLNVSCNTMLKSLSCASNQIQSLDVSKNILLTDLYCSNNQIESLDMSNNTDLAFLACESNLLSSSNLNALFETLPDNAIYKTIYISDNPGTDDCNRSIATKKRWWFLD